MKVSRRQKELLRQRDEILRVAERVFSEQGFFTTKIRDIAREAEFGIGTIYKHFKSKDVILFTIIKNKFSQLLSYARNNITLENSPVRKLRALVFSHLQYFEDNKDIFRLLIAEHVSFEKELRKRFMREMRKNLKNYFSLFQEIYREGIEKGIFKEESDQNILNLCLALIGMLNFTSFYKLNNMPSDPLVDNGELILNVFLNGVKR